MIQETRQIKFKAWSKIGNAWLSDSEYSVLMIDLEGCLYKVQSDSCETPYRDIDNFILCQFTGLQDKNKKDIYEKDIVDCCRYESNEIFRVLVKDIRFLPSEMFGSSVNWIEVVGNQFNNPELLNQ